MNLNLNDFLSYCLGSIVLFAIALAFLLRVQQNLRIKKSIVIVVGFIVNVGVTLLYASELLSRGLSSLIFNSIIICVGLFASKDKLANKIVNLIVYYVVVTVFDLLSYMTFSNVPSIPYWVASVVFALIMALALYFAEQFIKTFRNKQINRKGFVFLLIPISQVLTFSGIGIEIDKIFPRHTDLLEYSYNFSGITAIILCASAVLSFVADIIAFKQYVKSLDTAQIEAENKALEYKNKLNADYFNELKENETELRKIKHDISGCLETMKEIIYSEKNVDNAQSFFDEISHTLENITTGFYCKNSLINAIIINKSKVCNNNNINLNVDINIPEQLNISDMDICRALVNMLDNAIEANEKIDKEKFVNVSIKENDGFIYIHIDNPFNGESIEGTTKSNKKEHGYGLKILNDLAEKYDGYFKVEIENNIASSLMVVKNESI